MFDLSDMQCSAAYEVATKNCKTDHSANPSVHKDEVVMEGSYTYPQAVNKVVLKINIMVLYVPYKTSQNKIIYDQWSAEL
jgi:hypothetical protein